MHHLRKLTPSTAVAIAALVLAMSGTALAAGAIITSPDQVATGVINGQHVQQHSLAKDDLADVYMRVRVNPQGNPIGDRNDGTAVREQIGTYRVTFNSEAATGTGPRQPRDLSDCAVTATPNRTDMDTVPYQPEEQPGPTTLDVTRKTPPGLNNIPQLGPASVRVHSLKPTLFSSGYYGWRGKDTAFDVIVVC